MYTFHKMSKMFWEKIGLCTLLSHSSLITRPCEKGVGMMRACSWGLSRLTLRASVPEKAQGVRLGTEEAKAITTSE